MAQIKAIWGPHKTTYKRDRIVWSFTGVYGGGSFARWVLKFYFDSRQFRTRAVPTKPSDPDHKQIELLPAVAAAENKSGRVTPMLRACLKPEHIAEATRLALDYQRRHGR